MNSVDSEQTPHSATSDQGYTVCLGMSVSVFRVIMVIKLYIVYCKKIWTP